jgi:hypothetical protein
MKLKEKCSVVVCERRSCVSGQGPEGAVVNTIKGSWSSI